MKTKLIAISICIISVISCSSEKSKIKKALKASIPTELVDKYKFKSYTITETLLKNNVEDSISALKSSNQLKRDFLDSQRIRRDGYYTSLEDCKRQKRNTLYWLSSTYDSLIRQWEKMIQEANEKIQKDSLVIVANDQKISFFQRYLENTKSPIVFYKVNHSYTLNGALKNAEVMLDANYSLVQ